MISVIIPTWNRSWSLKRSLGSVIRQTGTQFELLVIDDHSQDDTPKLLATIVQEYTEPHPEADTSATSSSSSSMSSSLSTPSLSSSSSPSPPLGELTSALLPPGSGNLFRIITNPRQLGVSASRNIGIRHARGDLICFLDSDDEFLPQKLALQAKFMADHPELLISQCQERWIRRGVRVNPGRKHLKKAGDIFLESLKLCLISPSAVIIRVELLNQVGLFDENLPACEDYDLWLRILANHEVGLLNQELVIKYGGHTDQLSTAPGLDRYRIRSLKKILRQNLSPEKRAAAAQELENRQKIFQAGLKKRLPHRQ